MPWKLLRLDWLDLLPICGINLRLCLWQGMSRSKSVVVTAGSMFPTTTFRGRLCIGGGKLQEEGVTK